MNATKLHKYSRQVLRGRISNWPDRRASIMAAMTLNLQYIPICPYSSSYFVRGRLGPS